jgi:hypothetical protein
MMALKHHKHNFSADAGTNAQAWRPSCAIYSPMGIVLRASRCTTHAGHTRWGPSTHLHAKLAGWLSPDMANRTGEAAVVRRFYTPQEVAGLLGVSATKVMTRIHVRNTSAASD